MKAQATTLKINSLKVFKVMLNLAISKFHEWTNDVIILIATFYAKTPKFSLKKSLK